MSVDRRKAIVLERLAILIWRANREIKAREATIAVTGELKEKTW